MTVLSRATLRGETANAPAFKQVEKLDDRELMAMLAQGHELALGELYDRVGSAAYRIALRVLCDPSLAEDAVQEGFLSAWRSARSFDSRRGSMRAWVLMLVHRRAVDLAMRNQRQADHATEHEGEPMSPLRRLLRPEGSA